MKQQKIKLKNKFIEKYGDRLTPVEAFYRLRDYAVDPILMESSDYHSKEGSLSFLCIKPIAEIKLENALIKTKILNQQHKELAFNNGSSIDEILYEWKSSFKLENASPIQEKLNGFFGYNCFEAVSSFEQFPLKKDNLSIPELMYRLYQFVIVFDHFNHRMYYSENILPGSKSELDLLEKQLKIPSNSHFEFKATDTRISNMSDGYYMDLVEKGKAHCKRGDVFQIVLSRAFEKKYSGDEFLLYRTLRASNPSPYLFFFDYSDFKLMGSSPEAHLVLEKGKANIFPIAGTYKRTGNDLQDQERSKALAEDPKENAEHVMLVDLARNDLNRFAKKVKVESFMEIQFFSHVIHLVSRVGGEIAANLNPFKGLANSFPAGTLSGAPKRKAIELINKYEPDNRGFYGGSIGMINFNNDMNQAIIIRSLLCKDGILNYQAGAGIVIDSVPEKELQEVENKIAALENAIELANNF